MTRLAPLLCLVLLAACARSEEASLVQPDSGEGYNRIGKVRSPDANDREPAIGQWRASLQEDRQALEFGPTGTEPLFSLLCTANRGVLLQRHGAVPAGTTPAMQVTVGDINERLPAAMAGGTIPMLRVELPQGNRLLGAIATSGEPVTIRLDDAAPLVMPPSPLVGDYIGSCGRAQPAPAGGNIAAPVVPTPAGNSAAPAGNAAQPTG